MSNSSKQIVEPETIPPQRYRPRDRPIFQRLKSVALLVWLSISSAMAQPTNLAIGLTWTSNGVLNDPLLATDGDHSTYLQCLLNTGQILQAQLSGGPLDIGTLVLMQNNAILRRQEIRIFAGSSTDYTLNTECNRGQPVSNAGVISCDISAVSYIQILYSDTTISSLDLLLAEFYVYAEQDVAQFKTSSSSTGALSGLSVNVGPLPIDDLATAPTYESTVTFTTMPGRISVGLDQTFSGSQVMIYALSSSVNTIKIYAEDSTAVTSNLCGEGTISATTPFHADCSAYSADSWAIEVLASNLPAEEVVFTSIAILVPPCSKLTKAEFVYPSVGVVRSYDVTHGGSQNFNQEFEYIIEPDSCGWTLQSPIKIYQQVTPTMVEYTGSDATLVEESTILKLYIGTTRTELIDQAITYYFSAQVNDPAGSYLMPAKEYTIQYIDQCSSSTMNQVIVNDMTATYTGSQSATVAYPNHSLAQTTQYDLICRYSIQKTTFDLDTNTADPVYAKTFSDSFDLEIDAANDISLIGTHNVRFELFLAFFPNVKSTVDFVVTFTCDPNESNTLTIEGAAPSLIFSHDILVASDTTWQLSTYSLTPGSPCQTLLATKVVRKSDGADMISIMSFDSATSILTITGNGSEPIGIETAYQVILEVQGPDISGTIFHTLDEFNLVFTAGGACSTTSFVPDAMQIVEFEKVMNTGTQIFVFTMPYQLELQNPPTDCNSRSTTYVVDDGVGGRTVSYLTFQASPSSDVISVIVDDPDPSQMVGGSQISYLTTTILNWYQNVSKELLIKVTYKCPTNPVASFTTFEVFPVTFTYSLTVAGMQSYLANSWLLKPDNCNFVNDGMNVADTTDPSAKFLDTNFVFNQVTSEIELTLQDPYAEPFLQGQTLSYELQIQVSSSVDPTFSFVIEGLDTFDMLYAFDMPLNPAYDCQSLNSEVEALSITAGLSIPFVYTIDPVYTQLIAENTDRIDRMVSEVPNYCGPKTHVFKDQATNQVLSWITYVPDGLGDGTLTIDPQVNTAADIRTYTIEWTASLTNYLSSVASPAYILTVDVQCPASPKLTKGTQITYPNGIEYIIGSGPKYFDATPIIDSTNGFCFTFEPSMGIFSTAAPVLEASYDYETQRFDILTTDISLAGSNKGLRSKIAYLGNELHDVDVFTLFFIAMNFDCTQTVLDSAFYTDPGNPYTWKLSATPASTSVVISEPTDTIAVTAGSNYACGYREITFSDINNPGSEPAWLSINSNNDMTMSLIVDTTNEPDSVLGSYEIQVEISLIDYIDVPKVTITVQIDIVCPDNPRAFAKIGGSPQILPNLILIDTSLGVGTEENDFLEQYEVQPVVCGFPALTHTIEDLTMGTTADDYITADYTSGEVIVSYLDTISDGRHDYKWIVTLWDNSEHIQTFSVLYEDRTIADCQASIFPPETTIDWSWTWSAYELQSIEIPTQYTDVETTDAIPTLRCGPHAYSINVVDPNLQNPFYYDAYSRTIFADYGAKGSLLRQNNGETVFHFNITLQDWPDVQGTAITVKVTCACPATHYSVGVTFNQTQQELPKIYYENLGIPFVFPMNQWELYPYNDQGNITCFQVTKSSFYQKDTGLPVTYFTVLNFDAGLIEINTGDPADQGLTKEFLWKIDIDDGTIEKHILNFTVVFKNIDDCSETALQQGFPEMDHEQKMFETNIPRYPLPILTDEYAIKVGIPDVCGPRSYRFVDRKQIQQLADGLFIDEQTLEYWIDYQDINAIPYPFKYYLEVGLKDYPNAVKMYQYYDIRKLCSDIHHEIRKDPLQQTTLMYDVTEASAQQFPVQQIVVLPGGGCFSTVDVQIQDTAGNPVSFASILTNQQIVIDQAGNRELSWIPNPITLNLKYEISDGLFRTDVMTVTVQGFSGCQSTTFSPLDVSALQTQFGLPPAQFSANQVFDDLSISKSIEKGIDDYCGPLDISITQTDIDGTISPFAKGTFTSPSHGAVQIDFDETTYDDPIGTITFEVTFSLTEFPDAGKATQVITLEYLCPVLSLVTVSQEMERISFVYSANQQSAMIESLPELTIKGCGTISRTYIVSSETQTEVPFISVDSLTNELSLFTQDVDQALRGTTHEYTVLVDVSDGQTAIEIGKFSVKFIANNRLPYFETTLQTNFTLYREEQDSWTYTVPAFSDPDVKDELSLSVHLNEELAKFVVYSDQTLTIQDLKDSKVLAGNFTIAVGLTDGKQFIYKKISIVIHDFPATESDYVFIPPANVVINQTQSDLVYQKNYTEGNATTLIDNSTATNNITVFDEEQQIIQDKIFDWKTAFFKQEKVLVDSGQIYDRIPPQPRLHFIQQTGEVQVSFSQDMRVVPDFDMIQKGLVSWNDQVLPVLEIEVIASAYSNPSQLQFEWNLSGMTERDITFQLIFKEAIYVSAQYEPDLISIKFRDPYLFLGTNDLAMSKKELWEHLRDNRKLQQDTDQEYEGLVTVRVEEDMIVLEKEIPTQLPLGGLEQTIQEALLSTTQGSKVAMASNFVLNIIISASLNQLWAMINTQQLMIMMPLFQITMPANAGLFFRSLMEIAAFDFYDFSDFVHDLFQVEPKETTDLNFEAIGFESKYFLVNIGSLAVIFLVYVSCMPFVSQYRRCQRGRCKKICKRMNRSVFWGTLITLINESYIWIVVCVLINIQVFSTQGPGQTIMSYLTVFFLVASVVLPAYFICKIGCNIDKLDDKKIKGKYGSLYEGLNVNKGKQILAQPIFFLMRRAMLAIACCLVGKVFIWQVMIMDAQVLTQSMIIGSGVFVTKFKKNTEFFNEVMLMTILYTIFAYSPWVDDIQLKFYMGYVTISLAVLHLVINLYLIFSATAKGWFWTCKKKFVIKKYKVERVKFQKMVADTHEDRFEKWKNKRQIRQKKEWQGGKHGLLRKDRNELGTDVPGQYQSSSGEDKEFQAANHQVQPNEQPAQEINHETDDVLEIAKHLNIVDESQLAQQQSELLISEDDFDVQTKPNNKNLVFVYGHLIELSEQELITQLEEEAYQTTDLKVVSSLGGRDKRVLKPESIDVFGNESNILTKEDEKEIELLTGLPGKDYPIITTKKNQVQSDSSAYQGPPLRNTNNANANKQIVKEKPSRRINFAENIKAHDKQTFDQTQVIQEESKIRGNLPLAASRIVPDRRGQDKGRNGQERTFPRVAIEEENKVNHREHNIPLRRLDRFREVSSIEYRQIRARGGNNEQKEQNYRFER